MNLGKPMYKDDLQAAQARADAAEQRAERAEEKLKRAKKSRRKIIPSLNKIGKSMLKPMLVGVSIIAAIVGISFCTSALRTCDEQEQAYKQCITDHCHQMCRQNKSIVTSTWGWIYKESIFSCKCYLKEGEKLLNLEVPKKCSELEH
jgi:hypothetical protein